MNIAKLTIINNITIFSHQINLQGGQKKRESKLFYKSSQNICPIKMKICMHNLNTYSFQNIKHEILNPKTFLDIWRCFWFSKMKNEQKQLFLVYFGLILVRHLIWKVVKLGKYGKCNRNIDRITRFWWLREFICVSLWSIWKYNGNNGSSRGH